MRNSRTTPGTITRLIENAFNKVFVDARGEFASFCQMNVLQGSDITDSKAHCKRLYFRLSRIMIASHI